MSAAGRPTALALGLSACSLALLGGAPAAGASARLARTASAAPSLHLQLPSGWVSRRLAGGGLSVAIDAADLGAVVPAGARLTAQPVGSSPANVARLLAGVDRAPFVGSPTTFPTSVGGLRAQYVQWTAAERSGDETTRTIVVQLATGSSYTFTLEAPSAKWTPSFPAFDRILASVTFG